MIPHNMTLFKLICVQYQFQCQTLPIMKIDRGQIQFREYVSIGTEPEVKVLQQQNMLNVHHMPTLIYEVFKLNCEQHLYGQTFISMVYSFASANEPLKDIARIIVFDVRTRLKSYSK